MKSILFFVVLLFTLQNSYAIPSLIQKALKNHAVKTNGGLNFKYNAGFKCPDSTDLSTPIRLNKKTNRIECLANRDGCIWNVNTNERCKKVVQMRRYNITTEVCSEQQENDPADWCFKAKEFFTRREIKSKSHGFHCPKFTGVYAVIRRTSKKIQCLSIDGKNCISGVYTNKQCLEAIKKNIKKFKPVTCANYQFKDKKS